MGIEDRQLHIEVYQSHHRCHSKVDERPGQRCADGLAGLTLPLGPGIAGVLSALTSGLPAALAKAAKIAEIEGKGHEIALLSVILDAMYTVYRKYMNKSSAAKPRGVKKLPGGIFPSGSFSNVFTW